MLPRKTSRAVGLYLAALLILVQLNLTYSIEQNNLLHDIDQSKDNRKNEHSLDHGIEHGIEHDIGLKDRPSHHQSKFATDLDAWSHQDVDLLMDHNDNLAIETHQAFKVTENPPKSFKFDSVGVSTSTEVSGAITSTDSPGVSTDSSGVIPGVSSATDSTKSKPPPLCLCDPPCASNASNAHNSLSTGSGERTSSVGTFMGSLQCPHGRSVPRKDCPCCEVCPRQVGETCGGPDTPCDKQFGLRCSPANVCAGEYSIHLSIRLYVPAMICSYSILYYLYQDRAALRPAFEVVRFDVKI